MKTKIKQTLATALALIFVLCTLTACKSDNQTSIVGKWYDSSGEYLDIRSDGTYKLENDYGTGTWKILKDGQTIEFKDFYGSILKTRIEIDKNGKYIDLGNSGVFYNIKNIQNENLDSNEISVIKTKISPFSDNRALIEYKELSGKKYAAMIDTEGHILYKLENGSISFDFNNKLNYIGGWGYRGFDGVAYIYDSSNNCHIINKNGEVVTKSTEKDFNHALACGDGMVLVYKDNSNINGNKYCYGIIDSEGNWKTNFIEIPYQHNNHARYAGSGIFIINATKSSGGFKEYGTILFNSYTGKYDIMSADMNLEFINNIAYYKDNNDNVCTRINTDFEKEKVATCDYFTGGYSILKEEYLTITNCSTGKSVKFTEFKSNQISAITFKDNCGLVELKGNDGNMYFTIINSDGIMQFEPIKGWAYDWNKDAISYKDSDNGRCIMKTSGEKFFFDSDYLTYGYSDGICTARAYNDDDIWFYVNDKGEKILETLYD